MQVDSDVITSIYALYDTKNKCFLKVNSGKVAWASYSAAKKAFNYQYDPNQKQDYYHCQDRVIIVELNKGEKL